MKKLILILTLLFGSFLTSAQSVHAQMMGSQNSSLDQTAKQQQQAEEREGRKLLDQLKNKTTTCQKLTNDNFEKIGEYFMAQAIGNTSGHIQMNNMMKQVMGENGEEQMHISWGKRGSGCENTSGNFRQGGGSYMMGWGNNGMMNSGFGWGFGFLGFIFWIILIIDLILLGVWFWKKINEKK